MVYWTLICIIAVVMMIVNELAIAHAKVLDLMPFFSVAKVTPPKGRPGSTLLLAPPWRAP